MRTLSKIAYLSLALLVLCLAADVNYLNFLSSEFAEDKDWYEWEQIHGFLEGEELKNASFTQEEAKVECAKNIPGCRGFYYFGKNTDAVVQISFRNSAEVVRLGTQSNPESWRTAWIFTVGCNASEFDHCPPENKVRCCLTSATRSGRCGSQDTCQALAEKTQCSKSDTSECPTFDGVPCCSNQGRCVIKEKCDGGGFDIKIIVYIAIALFVLCGLMMGFVMCQRGAGAGDGDGLVEGAMVTYHGADRGQVGTLGKRDTNTGLYWVTLRDGRTVRAQKIELMVVGAADRVELQSRS